MSLNFIESFNGIDGDLIPRFKIGGWTVGTSWIRAMPPSSRTGRFGETNGAAGFDFTEQWMQCTSFNTGISDKLIIGFGFVTWAYDYEIVANAPWDILEFRDGTSQMCKIVLNANGTLSAVTGSTVVHTSEYAIQGRTWHYIEVKILLKQDDDGAGGSCQFQIDGAAGESESTGIDTLSTGTECDSLRWQSLGAGGGYENWAMDDVYVADSSPAGGTDFLGDVRVITLQPDANDGSPEFTPSTGSNFQNVDDLTSDPSDTTYNESNTPNHKDMFTMSDSGLLAADTVHGIAVNMFTKKVDPGPADMKLELDSGGTTDTSAAFTQTTQYGTFYKFHRLHPGGGAWSKDLIDALKAGYSRV